MSTKDISNTIPKTLVALAAKKGKSGEGQSLVYWLKKLFGISLFLVGLLHPSGFSILQMEECILVGFLVCDIFTLLLFYLFFLHLSVASKKVSINHRFLLTKTNKQKKKTAYKRQPYLKNHLYNLWRNLRTNSCGPENWIKNCYLLQRTCYREHHSTQEFVIRGCFSFEIRKFCSFNKFQINEISQR